MNFHMSIYENRLKKRYPFLAAHRGVCGANIPCNTLLAYKIALEQGADIVEIDVAKSRDDKFFAFHPGMEFAYLKCGKTVAEMTAEEVLATPIKNCDEADTHYRIPTLQEAFALLKDKVYINVDKFWTDIEGISAEIRKAGVEKQVIVKSGSEEKYFAEIEKYAPDLMYMPVVRDRDEITKELEKRKINVVGAEVLFKDLTAPVASVEYIKEMHGREKLVWVNSIIYDERDVLSAGLTDDISLENGGEFGWGVLDKLGFDIIQTDWLSAAKQYFTKNKKGN